MDETQTSTTVPGKSGPGISGNEGVFHTAQISGTWASPLDAINL